MSIDANKKILVADLREGEVIHELFLISRKNLAETKAGKPYLALTLMDSSGEIEARIWDNAARFDAGSEVGQIVAIEGQVKAFRDKLQLSIVSLQPVDQDSVPLERFMPVSRRSAIEMRKELAQQIESVTDKGLRSLLAAIFSGQFLEQFSQAPAAKMMHHAYLGGLLEHTLSVTGLAQHISAHYPELDRDLLLAGALLHDIGKVQEFSFASLPFDYTDSGRLIGHLVLGSEIVRQQAENIPELPAQRLDQLLHLVLSHHGKHEFGAPCLPMTTEAILLHHLDDMDAKVNYIGKLSEQVGPGEYEWSDFQRPLERFLLLRGTGKDGPEEPESSKSPQNNGEATAPEKKEEKNSPDKPARQHTLF